MFRKPFRVKSNVQLKTTDIKQLCDRLRKAFCQTSESNASLLDSAIPHKARVISSKVVSDDGSVLQVYFWDKCPMAFETREAQLLPTVYLAWKVPSILPAFTIQENTFAFLERGADLMMPGIVNLREVLEAHDLAKGALCSVVLLSEAAARGPVAVGRLAMRGADILISPMHGRGLQMIHLYGDFLWSCGPKGTLPVLSDCLEESSVAQSAAGLSDLAIAEVERAGGSPRLLDDAAPSDMNHEDGDDDADGVDALLERCFFAALKYRLKRAQLPCDVGLFYSNHLLKCVPDGRRLDMKKTRFKKFGVFMRDYADVAGEWLVKVVSKAKGIDEIVDVNADHPALRNFRPTDERLTDDAAAVAANVGDASVYTPPEIVEFFAATSPVLPLLQAASPARRYKKSDLLTVAQLRAEITTYVKAQGLVQADGTVLLDERLRACLRTSEYGVGVPWKQLFDGVLERMTRRTQLAFSDGRQRTLTGATPPVRLLVEKRRGNKKVTLVNNFDVYGLDADELAGRVQRAAACSTSVTTLADGHCQLMAQGDHAAFIAKLLVDTYQLPRRLVVLPPSAQKKDVPDKLMNKR